MEPAGSYDIAPDAGEIAIGAIEVEPSSGLIRTMIWTVPLRGAGTPKCLTREHPADDMRPRYTPDGRSIVFGQQLDPTFYADRVRLVHYDRAQGTFEEIAPEWKLSASHWEFAPDGSLIIEAEDEARVSLFRLRGTGVPERIARGGSISGTAPRASGCGTCARICRRRPSCSTPRSTARRPSARRRSPTP
jgi:hypothetical protein